MSLFEGINELYSVSYSMEWHVKVVMRVGLCLSNYYKVYVYYKWRCRSVIEWLLILFLAFLEDPVGYGCPYFFGFDSI